MIPRTTRETADRLTRYLFANSASVGRGSEARMVVSLVIEGWYNVRRRHSALGSESPLTHEHNHREALPAPYS